MSTSISDSNRALPVRTIQAVEQLEQRRLRAATVDAGVLQVVGTTASDVITVYLTPSDTNQLNVKIGNTVQTFDAGVINGISVDALRGDDTVTIDVAIALPTTITGGAGNDTINGGGGSDRVFGNEDNDFVVGNGAKDYLYGNDGNDGLYGGGGGDYLDAGDGDDSLAGSVGNDI